MPPKPTVSQAAGMVSVPVVAGVSESKLTPKANLLLAVIVFLICLCSLFQLIIWPTYISILMLVLHIGLGSWQVAFHDSFKKANIKRGSSVYYIVVLQYLFRSAFIFSTKLELRGKQRPKLQYLDLVYYFLTFMFFHSHFTHLARPLGAALDGTVVLPELNSGSQAMMGHDTQDLFEWVDTKAPTGANVAFFEWPRDPMKVKLVPFYGYKTVAGTWANEIHATTSDGGATYIKCTDASERKFSCFMRAMELGKAGDTVLYGSIPSSLFHMHLHPYDPEAEDLEQSCKDFRGFRAMNHPVWSHDTSKGDHMMFMEDADGMMQPHAWSTRNYTDYFMDLDLITVSAKTTSKHNISQVGERICMRRTDGSLVDADDGGASVCTAEKKIFKGPYYWKVLGSKCSKNGASVFVPRRNDPHYLHGRDGFTIIEDVFVVQGAQKELHATFTPITPAKESVFLRTLWNTPAAGSMTTSFGPPSVLYLVFFAPVIFLAVRAVMPVNNDMQGLGKGDRTKQTDGMVFGADLQRKFMLSIYIPALLLMFSIGAWFSGAGIIAVMITHAMVSFKKKNNHDNQKVVGWMKTTYAFALFIGTIFNFMHAIGATLLLLFSANGEYTLLFTPYLTDVIQKNSIVPGIVSMDMSPSWTLFMLLPSIVIALGFMAANLIDFMKVFGHIRNASKAPVETIPLAAIPMQPIAPSAPTPQMVAPMAALPVSGVPVARVPASSVPSPVMPQKPDAPAPSPVSKHMYAYWRKHW